MQLTRWRLGGIAAVVALVAAACNVPYDYDNDGKADVAYAVPSTGDWYHFGDPTPFFQPGGWRWMAPGDYDGNHTWEPGVVASDDATWITGGGRGTFTFAAPPNPEGGLHYWQPNVVPVPADYDGDGKTDAAWYRESDATWWIDGHDGPVQFGTPSTDTPGDFGFDTPVPGDYDGVGHAELATYSLRDGTFKIMGHANPIPVGPPDAMPAPADYDGDGKVDPAVLTQWTGPPSNPTSVRGSAWLFVANQAPVAVPDPQNSMLLAMPANYDGQPGDELATTDGATEVTVPGEGTLTIPGGASTNAFPAFSAWMFSPALRQICANYDAYFPTLPQLGACT
jgi:hypothetical protein